ncbi:MAG: L,D-transpeptidase family protein, partial [Nitrospiraceae bacterium]|nr:L,D-transpeptidase family protein [Nitrospiraceae bacterium]
SASDELLPRIWEMCKNGVRYGSQGGFLDCPSREKGVYLGDALIASHSHLVLTGDGSLTKKTLKDFQLSQRICPGIMAVAPGSFCQEIAEFSLQWPMALKNYYRYTGDRAFIEEMVDAAFDGLYGYFARFEGPDGLLTGMTEKRVLVDWPDNLRDGYDYDYAKERENTVLNAFYYASLCTAAELMQELGRSGADYEARAARVKAAFAERLLDAETGLFVDAPGSKHSSLHANALPLCFGLVAEENVAKVVALIREKRLSCGVYIAPFVIEACYRAGESELAYDLITSRDEHSWHEMLKHGATTCMEVWGPDQKWNTSWCHPWSSSPIYLIAERVMGLTPGKPGWETIRFEPHVPASLDEAMVTIPIPQGFVTARFLRDSGFTVTAPPGGEVDVHIDGVAVDVRHAISHAHGTLSDAQLAFLDNHGWVERVGDGLGVWVSIPDQMLRIIQGGELVWQAACSTAEKGAGSEMDSLKTPLGWHSVKEKFGDDASWGQIFRSKQAQSAKWRPGTPVAEDLVLTRLLALTGEERGKNQGGNVDSYARNIYIHGTNDEARIGAPASHGCIRLTNDDVILAYDRIPKGCTVLISDGE